ncbi:MAG TPA: threonine ammonia-lyase IlvA [Candidatus Sulfotelmatobacter sp.]|jgi:threonine dehydratase|nr:threonine ammonia-lyase IlvA [Candidatus Sulfotelmatobacter sp.]
MKITVQQIDQAAERLEGVIVKTPLQKSKRLSELFNANIYIKREDFQEVRSYKIRGAYNKISSLTDQEKKRGIVAASAGNHAQGVAFSCALLKIKGVIFMPTVTPNQKIERVKHFGDGFVEIKLVGDTYDDSSKAAHVYCEEHSAVYIHPFDDPATIAGQGTIGKEIYDRLEGNLDIVIVPIGGGGVASGVSSYLKARNADIQIFGIEPTGSPSMYESLKAGKVVTLDKIDTFVDGAAVSRVGDLTFEICQKNLEKIVVIPEGKICNTMINLYQNEGIVTEPAGALSLSAFDHLAKEIKGKTVVCILSGGNNDLLRYPEIVERSLVYQGRKHYLIIEFAQKPGQLRNFLTKALGPTDDIVRFEYMKKTNKERGAALVGIELKDKKDFEPLKKRMEAAEINFRVLTNKELLYSYII